MKNLPLMLTVIMISSCSGSSYPLMFECSVTEEYRSISNIAGSKSKKEIYYSLQEEKYEEIANINGTVDLKQQFGLVLTEDNKIKHFTNKKVTFPDGFFESKLLVDDNQILFTSHSETNGKPSHTNKIEINRVTGKYSGESHKSGQDWYSFEYEGKCVKVKDKKL